LRPACAAVLAEERLWSGHRSVVGVQRLVERDALTGPVAGLDATGDRVAQEEESAAPGELSRLDDVAGGQAHLRAGGDVEARLDDAVVTKRDADAGLRADEAALADGDALRAAAGQGPHRRRAAADVGAVADDHALADPALDHRGAEGAGVEVDEALVHDRRPGGEVRTEADPVGVADA